MRRAGAAALDLAWVAAGVFDGYFELDMQVWDLAAGSLMVEEAGGIVTDWAGGDGHLTTGDVAAGSPATHAAMLARDALRDLTAGLHAGAQRGIRPGLASPVPGFSIHRSAYGELRPPDAAPAAEPEHGPQVGPPRGAGARADSRSGTRRTPSIHNGTSHARARRRYVRTIGCASRHDGRYRWNV